MYTCVLFTCMCTVPRSQSQITATEKETPTRLQKVSFRTIKPRNECTLKEQGHWLGFIKSILSNSAKFFDCLSHYYIFRTQNYQSFEVTDSKISNKNCGGWELIVAFIRMKMKEQG